MANLLKGFLDNVFKGTLNPKGNLADFAHASRLYVDESFRLAPKQKFLYHVVFHLNPDAQTSVPPIGNHKNELNMLVKNIDLPKYTVDTLVAQQYNKKRKIQTKIQYDPIQVVFHDDNYGVTTALWESYYRYYFVDGRHSSADTVGNPNHTAIKQYQHSNAFHGSELNKFRFGKDADIKKPFFTSIQIYQMARKTYTCFTLVNPVISQWQHDTLNNQESGPVANMMQVDYEAVLYSRGRVENNAPQGFAAEHYDKTPSPNSLSGGGTTSLFGDGGVLSGLFGSNTGPYTYIGSALGQNGGGRITLGSILRTANRLKNIKKLSKEGLRQEGFNILTGAIGRIGGTADKSFGIPNTLIGRSSGNIGTGIGAGIKAIIRNK